MSSKEMALTADETKSIRAQFAREAELARLGREASSRDDVQAEDNEGSAPSRRKRKHGIKAKGQEGSTPPARRQKRNLQKKSIKAKGREQLERPEQPEQLEQPQPLEPLGTAQAGRTHLENQERAYIAASRRGDRSLEARYQSALMASEVHRKRTGRGLKITMEIVKKEDMYEEEEDDDLHLGQLAAQLGDGSPGLNRRVSSYFSTRRNLVSLARYNEADKHFSQAFPGVTAPPQLQPGRYRNVPGMTRHMPLTHSQGPASFTSPDEIIGSPHSPASRSTTPTTSQGSVPPVGLSLNYPQSPAPINPRGSLPYVGIPLTFPHSPAPINSRRSLPHVGLSLTSPQSPASTFPRSPAPVDPRGSLPHAGMDRNLPHSPGFDTFPPREAFTPGTPGELRTVSRWDADDSRGYTWSDDTQNTRKGVQGAQGTRGAQGVQGDPGTIWDCAGLMQPSPIRAGNAHHAITVSPVSQFPTTTITSSFRLSGSGPTAAAQTLSTPAAGSGFEPNAMSAVMSWEPSPSGGGDITRQGNIMDYLSPDAQESVLPATEETWNSSNADQQLEAILANTDDINAQIDFTQFLDIPDLE